MKYRYIFESYGEICGTNEIAKTLLANVKMNRSGFLIDTKLGTYFDAESNKWKEIKGAK